MSSVHGSSVLTVILTGLCILLSEFEIKSKKIKATGNIWPRSIFLVFTLHKVLKRIPRGSMIFPSVT